MSESIYIGIDVGTNNTCGYSYNKSNGKLEVITINGERICPSYVLFKENKDLVFGSQAKKLFLMDKYDTIGKFKYFIGRAIPIDEVYRLQNFCGTEVRINDSGNCYFHLSKLNMDVTPGDIYEMYINLYISTVKRKCHGVIEGVRISVPASFDGNQRAVIKEAAVKCGIAEEKVSLINEPSAAAYMYWHESGLQEGRVLVYDFGGGTFDVSLVSIHNGGLEVIDWKGKSQLGGTDIDSRIMDLVINDMEVQNIPLFTRDTPDRIRKRVLAKLMTICENSKILVQTTQTFDIDPTGIAFIQDKQSYTYTLTQASLNNIIQPYITETIDLVKSILDDNHLSSDDIDYVVLVGGSSLFSLVQSELAKIFGNEKIRNTISSKEVVAQGACMTLASNFDLREKTTYSLGLETKKHICWLIAENTPLPAQKVVNKATTMDYQTLLFTNLVQGHSKEADVIQKKRDYIRLEPIICDIVTMKKKGEVTFDITYTIEEDGCVKVRIVEHDTQIVLYDRPIHWKE